MPTLGTFRRVFEFSRSTYINPSAAIFLSRYENDTVSGLALMPAGNRAIYEWGFSQPSASQPNLPLAHRMHWEPIRWARKKGFAYYDMGGFWKAKGNTDSINRFKLGFAPVIQPVLGDYFFPLSPVFGRVIEAAIALRQGFRRGSDR